MPTDRVEEVCDLQLVSTVIAVVADSKVTGPLGRFGSSEFFILLLKSFVGDVFCRFE